MFAIRDKILFLKCNCWNWKRKKVVNISVIYQLLQFKVEIKVNEEYIKEATIFVFEFLFLTIFITIDDLKINANNDID